MSDPFTVTGNVLPVHGFVLAGGRSSRMGVDKALLPFCGQPMVAVAVEKLRSFCSAVSLAGNRDDLSGFAPVVPEARVDSGPTAGIEAGLLACTQSWALFVPVDVPLVPAELLRRWAAAVVATPVCGASYLRTGGKEQPAFCMWSASYARYVSDMVKFGERRVRNLLQSVDAGAGLLWICDAENIAGDLLGAEPSASRMSDWFLNVNTPRELADAETVVGAERRW